MTVTHHSPSQDDRLPITFTASAVAHVRAQLTKRGSGIGVRLAVEKRGCSGLAYVISYVDETLATDVIFPLAEDGLCLCVDPLSYVVLKGTAVDYVREGLNARFIYTNPNQAGSCGCGESFTV